MINPGDRFHSNYFDSYGTVTRYVDDNNWWFRLDPTLLQKLRKIQPPELKANTTPDKLEWV